MTIHLTYHMRLYKYNIKYFMTPLTTKKSCFYLQLSTLKPVSLKNQDYDIAPGMRHFI